MLTLGATLAIHANVTGWAGESNGVVTALSSGAMILSAPGWVLSLGIPSSFGEAFGEIALITGVGIASMMVCFSLLVRLCRRVRLPRRDRRSPLDAGRRRFLLTSTTALGALGATSTGVYASVIEPYTVRLKRYRVAVRDLPRALEGLRMVQLSDTHLGRTVPEEFLRGVVARAAALGPDLFLLTGDYVYGHRRYIEPAAEVFRALVGVAPTLGVLGNHDWCHGGGSVREALGSIGVRMIDNDRVYLDAGSRAIVERRPRGAALRVVGLGDLSTGVCHPNTAFDPPGRDVPTIVLAHNPDTAEHEYFTSRAVGRPRVDLMISGHTHGGQVTFPFIGAPFVPSNFGQKYLAGLVRGPRFPVLISRGIGMSGPPIRFGAPPELVEITLERA